MDSLEGREGGKLIEALTKVDPPHRAKEIFRGPRWLRPPLDALPLREHVAATTASPRTRASSRAARRVDADRASRLFAVETMSALCEWTESLSLQSIGPRFP
jgi:hypothetical protein